MNHRRPGSRTRRAVLVLVAGLGLALTVPALSAAQTASPGFTDTEVKIGGTCPTSGPLSSFGTICAMEEAYFAYVNAEFGGVKMADGKTRKIKYTWYNDEYSPPRTVQQVKRLVEQDGVAAVIGSLGTATNLAVWDYLNKREIPHLYVGTGATIFSADIDNHPWTMGWQLAYSTEASIYAEFIKSQKPDATVAVLYQNDDFGKDLLGSFKRAVQGSRVKVVAEESYEVTSPTVDSQVINLAASKADVILNFSIPRFAAQAVRKVHELPWKPIQIVVAIAASTKAMVEPAGYEAAQGVYSGAYLMDPTNPTWKDHPSVKLYRTVGQKYGSKVLNLDDPTSMLGFTNAQQVVQTLKLTREPTRKALMQAARTQCDVDIKGVLPGIRVCVDGKKDPFAIESAQMQQFKGRRWDLIGSVITTWEGRTPPPSAGGR